MYTDVEYQGIEARCERGSGTPLYRASMRRKSGRSQRTRTMQGPMIAKADDQLAPAFHRGPLTGAQRPFERPSDAEVNGG